MMDVKKAIKYFDGYGSPYDDLVIRALEKQIPERIRDDGEFGYCPSCRQIFNSELRNEYVIEYCPWCGQKLDLEENES